MSRAAVVLALVALLAVGANAQAGRFCHHSCYKADGVSCESALKAKLSLLQSSKVKFQVDDAGCDVAGCTAIIRYSFATAAEHKTYQAMEKTVPAMVAAYEKAGLVSATPDGLLKSGVCASLKTFPKQGAKNPLAAVTVTAKP